MADISITTTIHPDGSVTVTGPNGTWLAAPATPPVVPVPVPPPVVVPPAPTSTMLGTNLIGVADYEPEQPFANLFRQSRAWISSDGITWDDGRAIDVDVDGNVRSTLPGQKLRTLFYWALGPAQPTGDHVLTWTGSGTFAPFSGATVKSQSANRIVLAVTASQGIGLFLSGVDSTNPPRNLSLVPAANVDPKWSDKFLASLAPYKAIRFMDWQQTNGSSIVNPGDLPAATRLRYDRGVSLDDCIALCNQLHASPWFCVPHMATDATVQAMAAKVKALLDPNLGAFVEYSNEVWNSSFPQAAYAQQQGLALGLSTAPYSAQMLFHARRSAQVGAAFRAALGSRVRVVLGAQAPSPYWIDQMLASQNAGSFDVVAVAPYFGYELGTLSSTATMTLDALFSSLDAKVTEAGTIIANAKLTAAAHGAKLVAYEGGQHLVGIGSLQDNAALNALFDAANGDQRMGALYSRYLGLWRTNNDAGSLFMHYLNCSAWSKFGRWGSMRTPTDLSSPKRVALAAFASTP